MKKQDQFKAPAEKQEANYIVDEQLNRLIGKNLAPKKLADANKLLRRLKPPFPHSLNLGHLQK